MILFAASHKVIEYVEKRIDGTESILEARL
jgi:hypothetical protein